MRSGNARMRSASFFMSFFSVVVEVVYYPCLVEDTWFPQPLSVSDEKSSAVFRVAAKHFKLLAGCIKKISSRRKCKRVGVWDKKKNWLKEDRKRANSSPP